MYIDASINRWIRCVGLNICGTLILIKYIYSHNDGLSLGKPNDVIIDMLFLLFGLIATFYNGVYYAKISTEKYVIYSTTSAKSTTLEWHVNLLV